MKTTLNTIASTALSAAIVASSAIASASANELSAAEVWNPAPEAKDPPFTCTEQPTSMIKSVPGGEMMCLTRGEGICRDNEGVLGKWGFGLDKDSGALSLVDPDGAVMPMYDGVDFEGADKLCIQNIPKKALYKPWHKKNRNLRGEEQERDLASEDEVMTEPYMAIYGNNKRLAELICHGVGNQGVATQLKMTDLRGYNLAKEGFPFTVTKVKRGQLDDNEDNALWGVQVEHTYEVLSLQKVKPVLKAKIVYDDTYCVWVDNTVTKAPTGAPTVSSAPSITPAPTPAARGHGDTCSKFKECAPCKDNKCQECKTDKDSTEKTCTPIIGNKMYCDYYADEPGAEGEKNSKNKNSKDAPEIDSDAAYYSPFNLFGKCEVCTASSTDIMEAMPCKGQEGECCKNTEYNVDSTCMPLVHGGPSVCRPKCSITSEVCRSNDDCCNKMCHIDTSKGPGKEGIGFCMPKH